MCQVEKNNNTMQSCYQEAAVCRDAAGGRELFHFCGHIQAAKLAHTISEMAEGRRFWPRF